MLNKLFYIVLLLLSVPAVAQNRQELHGRVVTGDLGVEDILIVNLSAQREVRTGKTGDFTIMATVGDTLVAANTRKRNIILTVDNLKEQPFVIDMGAYELPEIVITRYSHLTAEGLGLVPKGQKQYTPAERRYKAAADATPEFALGMPGAVVPLDPLFNALSGRSAILKKALETEKKETVMAKVGDMYSDDDIVAKLKIPVQYVKGFLFYIADDKRLAEAVNGKNAGITETILTGLANKFLETIANGE